MFTDTVTKTAYFFYENITHAFVVCLFCNKCDHEWSENNNVLYKMYSVGANCYR